MTETVELEDIVQSDRIYAARHHRKLGRITKRDAENILDGLWDETEEVQVFARHRIESSPIPLTDIREEVGDLVREWCAERRTFLSGETPLLREIGQRMAASIGETIEYDAAQQKIDAAWFEQQAPRPFLMLLYCPKCGLQHIDAPDERTPEWTNPPHKSHLCHGCGCIWRPADFPTEGVASIETRGKADTWAQPLNYLTYPDAPNPLPRGSGASDELVEPTNSDGETVDE